MYQHAWFNKNNFTGLVSGKKSYPSEWIFEDDIECITPQIWAEHCLECAAPLCYNHCENWVERFDKKCCNTFYGLKKNDEFTETMEACQLKFRRWGKLESKVYSGFITTAQYKKLSSVNYFEEKSLLPISHALRSVSPSYKLNAAQARYRRRMLSHIGKPVTQEYFIIQCFTNENEDLNLVFEIYTPERIYYKNAIKLKKGYNQELFLVNDLNLSYLKKEGRIRIYPENNAEIELVLFLCGFVRLNDIGKKKIINKREPASKVKCVAWDLDNTVWGGILIESDPAKLKLRDGVYQTMQELDRRGIIQITASKNTYEDAIEVLKRLDIVNMFVMHEINWNQKGNNLLDAAQYLNIGIDTFALIDDSAFERGAIKDLLPCVRVYSENEISDIVSKDEFDVPITEESKHRREMYQTENIRKNIKKDFVGSDIEFLRSCKIEACISNIKDEYFDRTYELVQRTNQLNLSGKKYERDSFRDLVQKHHDDCYVVFCRDKYGEYGQVGFFMVDAEGDIATVCEYAMSCRVASKYLEPAIIKWILEKYHAKCIVFKGVQTKKNILLVNTMMSFGLKNNTINENELCLMIDIKDVKYDDVVSVFETE